MLPLFGVAWAYVFASIPLARNAYCGLMTPLVPELGLLPMELRMGVRIGIERADTITAGVTIGSTHIVSHARRHVPYSTGNPNQVAIPLQAITHVATIHLPQVRPWLDLSDGTPILALPGPTVILKTPHGDWLIPTDQAPEIAGIIQTRLKGRQHAPRD